MIHRSKLSASFVGIRRRVALLALFLAIPAAMGQAPGPGPVKVFLLAGQSNMQGKGIAEKQVSGVEVVGTLRDFIQKNPVSYGKLLDGSNNWVVRGDAWAWVRQGVVGGTLASDTTTSGDLTIGYGVSSDRIGPELGFGTEVADYFSEPVVVVKTCWGGTSLYGDFRSPTAVARRGGVVGTYYTRMMNAYQDALVAIAVKYPERPIELIGFGWHQGYNDRVDPGGSAEYGANIADFILDVRTAFGKPALPFVIATTSMGTYPTLPYDAGEQQWITQENAQLAMDAKENVTSILTAPLYREPAVSPGSDSTHWNFNGETLYRIGEQMGDAMVALLTNPEAPDTTAPGPNPMPFATPPTALNSSTVTMTATTATDDNGVQYRFTETSGSAGGTSSDWQYDSTYIDSGLTPGLTYSYSVEARDQSAANNTTLPLAPVSVTTPAADTTAPTPDPMSFASNPAAVSAVAITMTASIATDNLYGVEYSFEETSGNPGGSNSGWQASPTYKDTGLRPSTSYSYRVRARDKEATPNETGWSGVQSTLTPATAAGEIAWATPSDISGPTDVSTHGTLVASYTGDIAGGNVTVNGVTFTQGRIPNAGSSGNIGGRVPTTGNANYDSFLQTASYGFASNACILTDLAPGATYEVQVWAADNAKNPAGMRSLVLDVGTPYAVSLIHEPTSGAPGQYSIGTFTAATASQSFSIIAYDYYGTAGQTSGGGQITNGLQLRLLSGPVDDATPPLPNTMSWVSPPAVVGANSIAMTATTATATDASGIEYYFDETSGNPGGTDSGWQDSPSYIDTGLTTGMQYTYTVQARDKSLNHNTNIASNPASATPGTVIPGKITWGTATNITGLVSDVSTAGTLVAGSALTGTTNIAKNVTVNGVAFVAGSLWTTPSDTIGNRVPATVGAATMESNYRILLQSQSYGTTASQTITLSGLTINQQYQIQVWASDTVQTDGVRSIVLDSTRALYIETTANSWGQYVLGTFTASGATQTFTTQGYNYFGGVTYGGGTGTQATANGLLSGLQVRKLSGTPPSPYHTWAAIYSPADLSDLSADNDHDGLTNFSEYAFALNPTSGSSANPISVPLDKSTGTFSYTRRTQSLTNLNYTVQTSTTLATGSWTTLVKGADYTEQVSGSVGEVETVQVKLTPAPTAPKLFIQVRASE